MRERQGPEAEGSLVPPRPNLGPEPWPEPPGWSGRAVGAMLGLMGLLLLLAWRWQRRRVRRHSARPSSVEAIPEETVDDPRRRLIASAEVARGALIAAFGPAWRSKTTEEIADDTGPSARFEPAEVERLVALLRLADRVKFASADPGPPDDWEAWSARFASRAASALDGK